MAAFRLSSAPRTPGATEKPVIPALFSILLAQAAAPAGPTPAASPAARRSSPAAMVSADERRAAAEIRPELLRAHMRFLASDLLEGRGPGSRGDELAQAYIAAQMEAAGLEPGAPGGGWLQPVELIGVTSRVDGEAVARGGGQTLPLAPVEELVAFAGVDQPEVSVRGAEVVFVGYGIQAPEFQWDDLKGADLRGKVLLFLNNDPADDPKLFAGKTRLYYGRWDYKYEQAARAGAAGALIVHTRASAGYPWTVVQSSWTGELFHLPPRADQPRLPLKAWLTEEASRRLVGLGGQELDTLRAAAEKRDFRPVPLGVTVDLALKADVRRTRSANVIGRLPGSDPALSQEAVIFSAHHDHFGVRSEPGHPPVIYNGAVDNASGVAMLLAVARAARALPAAPRRSLYFAAVAAEEQGLLGSAWLAANLPLKSGRVAANVNIDGLNFLGRTRDVVAVGQGKSSLDDYVAALARMQERTVVPDPFPDRGSYYRSDQFSFARVGIPGAYVKSGTDVVGRPAGWARQQRERFENEDYHQPGDDVRDDWDYSGAIEDGQLYFFLGLKVANAPRKPAWKPGDEFEAVRKAALEEIGEAKE